MPLRVVDVQNMCLTDLPLGAEYVALSYVWGDSNFVTTVRENEAAFLQTRGLVVHLPQTLRDAIDGTGALGLRYIWIDALCIAQDDYEVKNALMGSMGEIYSSAILTLVAATSQGADSGLSGWTDKKGRCPYRAELSNGVKLGVFSEFAEELKTCNHKQRAWT